MQPTFWQVARRREWLLALLGCLLVVAAFGGLAIWQSARAIEAGTPDDRDTETPVALETVAKPGHYVTTEAGGRIVTVTATLQPEAYIVLPGRQQEGQEGCWVTTRAIVAEGPYAGASLAVAEDFVPGCAGVDAWVEERKAAANPTQPIPLVGRYLPSEPPQLADIRGGTSEPMSVGYLINRWPNYEGPVFGGYLVQHRDDAPGETRSIHSEPPTYDSGLNWLNIFYALEWVVFAGFAIYFWIRLVLDARNEEREAGQAPPEDDFGITEMTLEELEREEARMAALEARD